MAGIADPKKKKVIPTSKVPETGAGSRDAGSYGIRSVPEKIAGLFKSTGGLDDDARARLFPGTVPAKNSTISGYSDISGLQKAEAKAGLRPKMPVGNSSSYGSNQGTPVKSQVDDKLSIDRFDPNKLTLGNGPDGQVGMFKDGQMLDPGSVRLSGGNLGGTPLPAGQSPFFMKSEAAKTLVPQPGTASAIPGMQQNPAVTTLGGNMTGLMNQETAMLSSVLQGTKSGANFGQNFGQAPAAPGGAPQIGDRAYRDLERNITDMRNQQKAFMSGNYSPSAFGTLSPTKRMAMAASLGEQIKGMEDTLFNRSSLANDLVKALVAAQSGENIAGTAAAAGTEQQKIKTAGDIQVGAMDAAATQGSNAYKQDVNAEHKNKTRQSVNIRAGIKSLEDEYAQNQDPSIKKQLDDLRAQLLTLEADDTNLFAGAPDAN